MDSIEIVKAYFKALHSSNMEQVDQYLSDDYQLVGFMQKPMIGRSCLISLAC